MKLPEFDIPLTNPRVNWAVATITAGIIAFGFFHASSEQNAQALRDTGYVAMDTGGAQSGDSQLGQLRSRAEHAAESGDYRRAYDIMSRATGIAISALGSESNTAADASAAVSAENASKEDTDVVWIATASGLFSLAMEGLVWTPGYREAAERRKRRRSR
ncbi:MAG TPA: hypothetical protein VGS28_02780 [Candidatus Saccharimonadales bacterium]|nr:hypothetical protein [Candidatus Saccharimonadales bacterium]